MIYKTYFILRLLLNKIHLANFVFVICYFFQNYLYKLIHCLRIQIVFTVNSRMLTDAPTLNFSIYLFILLLYDGII